MSSKDSRWLLQASLCNQARREVDRLFRPTIDKPLCHVLDECVALQMHCITADVISYIPGNHRSVIICITAPPQQVTHCHYSRARQVWQRQHMLYCLAQSSIDRSCLVCLILGRCC